MKNAKKLLALLLALVMVVALAACGGDKPGPAGDLSQNPSSNPTQGTEPTPSQEPEVPATYTYQDSVSTLATNWNPHTYQTTDDSYPASFLRSGLYEFIFNDELNPVEGKDPYQGYVIRPEMAASLPVDVTEQVKAEHPEYGIPESATAGYAYTIDLNPDCVWEDGTPINADTYVYSMMQLLDSKLLNYRATDYYAGDFCIAGAEAYANSGNTSWTDNSLSGAYTIADLTKGEDGNYDCPTGDVVIAVGVATDWLGGNSLADYVGAYGAEYFGMDQWDAFYAMMDEDGYVPCNDDTLAMLSSIITTNEAWGEDDSCLPYYLSYAKTYPVVEYEGTVGLYKSGDYQITLVLGKSLAGFNLLYNLSGNWIVYQPYYDANLKEDNGYWSSTYNTNVETTMSYGPYKLTQYQTDKFMKFERNENWWGYHDGEHVYVDPVDGKTYDMYMTDIIECEVVAEAETRKLMFLKGELMGYGLQAADFDSYRNSDYVYFTPSETIFFLILNGHKEAIADREAADTFDTATTDLQTMTLASFRSAVAVTYDKELFASTVSPARSGGYGIIGSAYVYDPDTGARYRDTDQAKQVLCDFYGVDVSKFGGDLDKAVDSITGYDPELAKTLYNQAFQDALAEGYITDNDNDGISDQTVQIEYCLSADSDFMTTTINYLNEKMAEVTAGTAFEGKIKFIKSAPYGNDWSNKIRAGLADTVLGGWSGSALNPFSLTDLYVNPENMYDAAWFDAATVSLTKTINGEEITMNLRLWSDALNGATVTADNGKEYCFGDGIADIEVRLDILAAIEGEVLKTGNYLPMLQDASAALLSQQVYYVVEEYNPVMGRGGIAYMKYNYSDAEWVEYVAAQGGELKY